MLWELVLVLGLYGSRRAGLLLVLAAEGKKIGGNGTVGGLLAGENSRLWEMTVGRFCAEKKRKNGDQRGRGFSGEGRGTGEPWATAHGSEEEEKWKIPLYFVAGDEQK